MRAALFAAAVLTPAVALAYPIAPRTLWELTRDAELVVVAQVEEVVSNPNQSADRWGDSHLARLAVHETWKGSPVRAVEVTFDPGIVCPAPPRYVAHRRVVAFLSRREGAWYTVALSYGTRYPATDDEERAYAAAVRTAATLQGPTPAKDAPPTLAWALETARHRSTRWDGLYALRAGADVGHAFYDRRRRDAPLGDEALAGVEALLVEAPSYDETLVQLLRLLEERPDPKITLAAADAIETVLHHQTAPWWIDDALEQLALRLGKGSAPPPPTDPVAAEAAFVGREHREKPEEREARLQERWEAFKKQHRLSPRVRDDYSRAARTGTGGQTPL